MFNYFTVKGWVFLLLICLWLFIVWICLLNLNVLLMNILKISYICRWWRLSYSLVIESHLVWIGHVHKSSSRSLSLSLSFPRFPSCCFQTSTKPSCIFIDARPVHWDTSQPDRCTCIVSSLRWQYWLTECILNIHDVVCSLVDRFMRVSIHPRGQSGQTCCPTSHRSTGKKSGMHRWPLNMFNS